MSSSTPATITGAGDLDAVSAEAVRLISQLGDAVLHAVDQGIYCLDNQGRTTFVNEAAARMLGYTLREMLGKSQHELIHHHYGDGKPFPVEACPIWASVTDGVHQRVGGDIFWRKDGTPLPVDYTSIPLREGRRIVAVVVTFRDMTTEQQARQQAERLAAERAARQEAERSQAALMDAEERFRLALEAGRMGTWEWDIAGKRVHWSPQEERMYGLEPGAFSGTMEEYGARIHPDDREQSLAAVQESLARRAPTHHVLHRIVWPNGDVRWLESHGRFTYGSDGTPLRLTGVSTDVTEQHLGAEQLRLRDERFRALIAASGQIVWTNSAEGRMEDEQPGWGEFTGQTREQYQGFGWADAVHPEDAQPTVDAWNAAVAARRTFVFEHRVRRHDGVYRRFAIRAVPVLNADGSIREWVGSHTDVTEQRELEAARDRALAEAQHARENLLRIFEEAPAAIATMEGPTHVFRTANAMYRQIVGNRDVIGRPVRAVFPELESQGLLDLLDQVYASGQPYVGNRVPVSLDLDGTGKLEQRLFSFVYQPLRDADGQVTGIMVHAIEVDAPVVSPKAE